VNHRTPLFLILTVMLFFAAPVGAQTTQKTGFVNSAKIFQELPEAKDAEKRLESFTKPVQDSLQMMQKEIEGKISEYQKKESLMNDQAKRTAQAEIQEMTQRAREFASKKDQELAAQRERILNPLKDKVLKAIERVAKEDKYTFVFDQTEQVQILLYGDPNHDLTFKVIDRLKRGK
jgi:outer membrane protein